jgi:endonuclease/exonuclease/phosphatase family metal-dependent hydrolase
MRYILIILLLLLTGCGIDDSVNHTDIDPDLNELTLGTAATLEVVTWNIQNFPKMGSNTVDYLEELIIQIDADIFCLQEIQDLARFTLLDNALNDWDGYRSTGAAYDINLAVLFRNSADFQLLSINELFTDDWWAFPRSPIQLEILWNNEIFYVINNHLKAGGNSEDEDRRELACQYLAEYVNTQLAEQNVIIAGDLNDLIIDPPDKNVFYPFLDDTDNYLFADYEIAWGSPANWSWNNGTSHLDHIIISNELFSEFANPGSIILTIQIDDYLQGGWNTYDTYISDHLPVAIRLDF